MKTLIPTLTLWTLLPAAAQAEPELPVILFAGQSNMVGLAKPNELTAEQAKTQDDAYYYFPDGTWGPFEPVKASGNGLGPELSAGRAVAAFTGRVGMIKYAVGGTNLALQWNPAVPGGLYEGLVRYAEGALAALKAQTGMRGRVVGFFWMQGESDATDPNMTVLYAANLTNLIARVRSDFGDPDLPFVFGRISPSPLWRYGAYVRAAQQSVADSVPNTALFSADDLPLLDGAHYTTQGVATLGERFAEAFLGRTKFEAARFISKDVPAEMTEGKTYKVSVTMRNTGTLPWTRAQGFKLGSQSPQDNTDWGLGRVELAEGERVAPGALKTFTFEVTAPEEAGKRPFEWRMVRENVLWFGDTTDPVMVKVSEPAAPKTLKTAALPVETDAPPAVGVGTPDTGGVDGAGRTGTAVPAKAATAAAAAAAPAAPAAPAEAVPSSSSSVHARELEQRETACRNYPSSDERESCFTEVGEWDRAWRQVPSWAMRAEKTGRKAASSSRTLKLKGLRPIYTIR